MAVTVDARALGEDGAVSRPSALGHVDLLDRVPADGVLGDRVGDGLGVEQVRLVVQVVDVVADQVVVDVVGDAGLAAEHDGLLGRLDLLGAREDTARGDAVLDEGGVVGAAAELGGDGVGVVGAVEVLKLLLDSTGARGTGQVESAAITVVDSVDVVGAGNLSFPD